jgi:hypothetical protein
MAWNLQQTQSNFLAQLASRPFPVKVGTVGGKSVTGTLTVAYIQVVSDLGVYAIKPEKVKEVQISAPAPDEGPMITGPSGTMVPGVVVTRSGDEIAGKIAVNHWQVETDLGSLMLNPETLKSVAITGEPQAKTAPDGPEDTSKRRPSNTSPARSDSGAKEKDGK